MKTTKEQKLLQDIITKAWEDEDFKQELISNPIPVLERLTGKPIKLPEGKSIVVLDQMDESKIFINIPPKPNVEDMELNEAQLEIVAGGGVPDAPILTDPSVILSGIF